MRNVKLSKTSNTLVIEISLADKGEVSESGKSTVIASTGGNTPIVIDGVEHYLGVNFYRPVKAKARKEIIEL